MKRNKDFFRKNKFDVLLMLIVIVLYVANNMFIKPYSFGRIHVFFDGYFNDLMAPLFMLGYSNIVLSSKNMRISSLLVIVIFIGTAGCVWEFLAPLMKESSISDPLDLVCYICGAVFYWILQRNRNGKNRAD